MFYNIFTYQGQLYTKGVWPTYVYDIFQVKLLYFYDNNNKFYS